MSRARPRRGAGRGGRGAADEAPTADYVRPLVERGATPGAWDALDVDELLLVAFQLALYVGTTGDAEAGSSLGTAYDRLQGVSSSDEGMELLERLVEAVRAESTSVLALLPFVQRERDALVVQAAATSFASLLPRSDDDPMTGPRTVRALIDHAEEESVRVGLLAGLLALGDRRVLPLLRGAWRALGPEGRESLARTSLPFATASVAEFWLDWLEDADPADVPFVADALARLPAQSGGRVLDLVRRFPEQGPDDEPEIEVVGEWTVSEFAERLAPRLADLERRGLTPAALTVVRTAWRVSAAPPAGGQP